MTLTNEQIDQLTGRELDRAVAQHVMRFNAFEMRYIWGDLCDEEAARRLYSYSSDESLAAEVRRKVESTLPKHWSCQINYGYHGLPRCEYSDINDIWASGEGSTVAEASCKAALKLATRGKG